MLKSLVTMSAVTYFIPPAHMMKNCICDTTVKKKKEDLEKMNVNGPGSQKLQGSGLLWTQKIRSSPLRTQK